MYSTLVIKEIKFKLNSEDNIIAELTCSSPNGELGNKYIHDVYKYQDQELRFRITEIKINRGIVFYTLEEITSKYNEGFYNYTKQLMGYWDELYGKFLISDEIQD